MNWRERLTDLVQSIEGLDFEGEVMEAVEILRAVIVGRGTIFACGNGGSMADAQHFVAEFTGKLSQSRQPISAVALGTSAPSFSAIANDFGFQRIFSRELEAMAKKEDVLVCFSTSGSSENVLEAAKTALLMGLPVIALTGGSKSGLSSMSSCVLSVGSNSTQTIQEAHTFLLHYLCHKAEEVVFGA